MIRFLQSRPLLKYAIDALIWVVLTPLAFLLRVEGNWMSYLPSILVLTAVGIPLKGLAVYVLGFHRRSWRKTGLGDVQTLVIGIGIVTALMAVAGFFLSPNYVVPRSLPIIEGLLALAFLGGGRTFLRMASQHQRARGHTTKLRRVLIVGAGEAGTMCARELIRHPESGRRPIGYLDDNPAKQRQYFGGVPVLGAVETLLEVVKQKDVDEVLIAMPSQDGALVRQVVEMATEAGVEYRIVPSLFELLNGRLAIGQIREVDVQDLLGRDVVRLDMVEIERQLARKTVLVTGAGGSIGSELVRQVSRFGPERIILLGRGENSIYEIAGEMARTMPGVPVTPVITDVRDLDSLRVVFERHRPQVVFHAAAHKHVPLMEANPSQAIFNNVGGTRNLVALAAEYGVERFVNVSTDKAVNPTSVMGASKRVAEMLVQRAAAEVGEGHAYVSVRFGNVLGSRGSVVPLFRKQIEAGGPVTVTHPEMERYFMTIPEAVQLVLQAGSMAQNGAVYVLDMGEPVRIVDLARDLILLCGKQPDRDIKIEFSGMRPGEKLYEELLLAEEGTLPSSHEKVFVARAVPRTADLDVELDHLFDAAAARDGSGIRDGLARLVPTCKFEQAGRPVPAGGDGLPHDSVEPSPRS